MKISLIVAQVFSNKYPDRSKIIRIETCELLLKINNHFNKWYNVTPKVGYSKEFKEKAQKLGIKL
jgi:hypothetical protein